jgi:hypothetical protein
MGSDKPRAMGYDLVPLLKVRATHGVVVAFLFALQIWLQMVPGFIEQPGVLAELLVAMLVRGWYWILGFELIAVVQAKIEPGRIRIIVLVLCVAIVTALYEAMIWADTHYIVIELGLLTMESFAIQGPWMVATYLLLAVWYYESADHTRRSIAALRETELARRGAERWLLELRLGSLQARLDPQVLFDTLDDVCRLYRATPAAAERLLDALIQYLRRALPQLRQAQSTLEQEVALATAFLRVLRTRVDDPLDIEAVVDANAADARFPPMVVQPICDAVARLALATGEPARINIFVAREHDTARLNIAVQPVRAAPSGERLEDVRRTLLAMFGPLVRTEANGPTDGVVQVEVEVPYDPAESTDS